MVPAIKLHRNYKKKDFKFSCIVGLKGNTNGGFNSVQIIGDYQVTHEDFIISSTICGVCQHYNAGDMLSHNRPNH